MNRWTVLLAAMLMVLVVAMGCSGSGDSPVAPSADQGLTTGSSHAGQSQTHLWGYYDVYIDIENQTVEAVLNREVMFAANVVQFLNGNPMGMQFNIIETPIGPDYVDVKINVGLTHPLPGMPQYNGYDVRGIFIGDGSQTLDYGTGCRAAAAGFDQWMFSDNADGYTRWWNPGEFTVAGVLGYTPGDFATRGYTGNATINPYKYFADNLGAEDDVWEFINTTSGRGVFSSGRTNTRYYHLRFPNTKGVSYNYAIVANWAGEAPGDHPANADEAVALSVYVEPDIYYVDESDFGGDLILDINVPNWPEGPQPTGIYVESDIIGGLYTLDSLEMEPVGGTDVYSTYHVEIPTGTFSGTEGFEYWVICEYDGYDYKCEFTPPVPGAAPNATLAAFFRYDLYVSPIAYNKPPVCEVECLTPMPYEDWATEIEFSAEGSYDPDPDDTLTFEWDFDGDGTFGDPYDSGTDDHPFKYYDSDYVGQVCVRVSDGKDETECCCDVDITAYKTKNIPLREGVDARDLAMDNSDGDLYILYSDGAVYKYTEDDYYQDGSSLATTSTNAVYMDASPNGDFLVSSGASGFYCRSFYASGSPASNHTAFSANTWAHDGVCPAGGSTNNRHCSYYDCSLSSSYVIFWMWQPPSYGGASGYLFTEGTGYYNINHNYMRGTEADPNGYVYVVEDSPEYRVERRHYYMYSWSSYYWGGFGDDSPNFNDPRDITRDDSTSATLYVLDELSTGEPAIKKFTYNGTPQGTFGDSTSISGDPLRIEGSQRLFQGSSDNLMFVLHGDSTDGYFLSIFFEDELTE